MAPWAAPLTNLAADWAHKKIGDNLTYTDPPADSPSGPGLVNLPFPTSAPIVDSYNSKAINKLALSTWLCPENYISRMPDAYLNDACGICKYNYEIDLTVNNVGNACMYVNPHAFNAGLNDGSTVPDARVGSWFIANYIGNTFNPTAGDITPTLGEAVYFRGPYWNGGPEACNLRDGMLIGAAINVYNVQSALGC